MPGERRRFLVALLVPEPVATELDGLRRALGSSSLGRIPPHITLVPPRNVSQGDQEGLPGLLRAAAATAAPLRLSLGPPRTFAPRTPVVYLAVGGDLDELAELAAALASGTLAPPPGRTEREFVPHVTLTGDAGEHRASALLTALGAYRALVTIEHVTLLVQEDDTPRRPWRPVADAALQAPAVVGRGGLELALRVAQRLDPEEQDWFDRHWTAYSEQMWGRGLAADEPFALTARRLNRLVGVATGSLRPELLHLRRLLVDAAERRQGIGAQLLRACEDLARHRAGARVRLETALAGPAQRFYERSGYSVVAILPEHRGGRDFVVMERRL